MTFPIGDGRINPNPCADVPEEMAQWNLEVAEAINNLTIIVNEAGIVDTYQFKETELGTAGFWDEKVLGEGEYDGGVHQQVFYQIIDNQVFMFTVAGGGSGGGDTYKVKVASGGTEGFLDTKIHADTWEPTDTYNSGMHFTVLAANVGDAVRFYGPYAIIKNSAGDSAPTYLTDKFADVTTTPYNADDHMLVSVLDLGSTLRLYTPQATVNTYITNYFEEYFTTYITTYVTGGCGILVNEGEVSVDNADLAGAGLIPAETGCGLDINYGCGLQISDDALVVDVTALAGDGLGVNTAESACELKVNAGAYIQITGDAVAVDQVSLAAALADGVTIIASSGVLTAIGGGGNLAAGCGITIGGGTISVDADDMDGVGLTANTEEGACLLDVDICEALEAEAVIQGKTEGTFVLGVVDGVCTLIEVKTGCGTCP